MFCLKVSQSGQYVLNVVTFNEQNIIFLLHPKLSRFHSRFIFKGDSMTETKGQGNLTSCSIVESTYFLVRAVSIWKYGLQLTSAKENKDISTAISAIGARRTSQWLDNKFKQVLVDSIKSGS